MDAFGQTTKRFFQLGRKEDQMVMGKTLTNFVLAASFPSNSCVSAVSLSFHLNWDNKYSKSLLSGRNSASWEYQLLCLSLFQPAQLWAVEQTVWMARGGILNPDITQSACGGNSECTGCHSPARNRTSCLEGTETVQGAHCAGPCLPGAKTGSFSETASKGCECLYLPGAGLLGDVLAWAQCTQTWHWHTVCVKFPPKQGHPFPGSPTNSRSRIIPSLQSWLWWLPLPSGAANCQGDLGKAWRPKCCEWGVQLLVICP